MNSKYEEAGEESLSNRQKKKINNLASSSWQGFFDHPENVDRIYKQSQLVVETIHEILLKISMLPSLIVIVHECLLLFFFLKKKK